MDAVVSGTFRVTMAEGAVDLGPGDALLVPRGTDHAARVIGGQPVVSLDAVREGR
jgi:mannose-6-phosphate isomerase-like protein (cupin superfamily)